MLIEEEEGGETRGVEAWKEMFCAVLLDNILKDSLEDDHVLD